MESQSGLLVLPAAAKLWLAKLCACGAEIGDNSTSFCRALLLKVIASADVSDCVERPGVDKERTPPQGGERVSNWSAIVCCKYAYKTYR